LAKLSVTDRSSLAKVAVFPVTPMSFQPSATSPWRTIETALADWMNTTEKEPDKEPIIPRIVKGGVSLPKAGNPAVGDDSRADAADTSFAPSQRIERFSAADATGPAVPAD